MTTGLRNDPPAKKVSVYVWQSENRYSSEARVEAIELPVSDDYDPQNPSLELNHIKILGKRTFEESKKPGDAHSTRTQNHDSFDQAVAFKFYQYIAERYAELTGNKFGELVAAKTDLKQFTATVNGMRQVNAYYQPASESMVFGTSNGKWDLGADGDVVIHEMGHFILDHLYPGFSSGKYHESYGDIITAFLTQDPEISEDFGVYREEDPGTGLRHVYNDLKISTAGSGGHAIGRVYSGLLWDVAELMHEQITGEARKTDIDAERLNKDAADAGAMIVLDWPLRVRTNNPTGQQWITAIEESIKALAQAEKFHEKIDVDAVLAKLRSRAIEREIISGVGFEASAFPATETSNTSRTLTKALRKVVQESQIANARCDIVGSSLVRADGTRVYRAEFSVEQSGQRFLVVDDLVSVTEKPISEISRVDRFESSLGNLEQVLMSLDASEGSQNVRLGEEVPMDQMTGWEAEALEKAQAQLMIDDSVFPQWMQERAEIALATDDLKAQWVFRHGLLRVRLELDTLNFEAVVNRDGSLGDAALTSALLVD